METTEKIVEAYVRYIKGWATIPNIKCTGQFEIDLLAIDPKTLKKYHIESSISISGGFSRLTTKPFSTEQLKERAQQAEQRRTIGYFAQRKFGAPEVIAKLEQYGFKHGQYEKIVVTWGWTAEAEIEAEHQGIKLWDFKQLITDIAGESGRSKTYYTDDTLRTLQLSAKATG